MKSLMGEGAGDIRETSEQSVDTVKLEHYHNQLSDSLSTWEKVQNPSPIQMRYVYLTFLRSKKLGNTLSRSDHLGEGSSLKEPRSKLEDIRLFRTGLLPCTWFD